MRAMTVIVIGGLLLAGRAQATDCSLPIAQPLQPMSLAPIASELAPGGNFRGAANGVLAGSVDESQSVDQVLLRIRIDSCQNVASMIPSPGVVSPDNPAAYKPRTQFDNTPWRFNMNQNGKNMTADEFSAWMSSRGVHVARGAGTTQALATPQTPGSTLQQPVSTLPPVQAPLQPVVTPQPSLAVPAPDGQ